MNLPIKLKCVASISRVSSAGTLFTWTPHGMHLTAGRAVYHLSSQSVSQPVVRNDPG
jgi:hypothetical protein